MNYKVKSTICTMEHTIKLFNFLESSKKLNPSCTDFVTDMITVCQPIWNIYYDDDDDDDYNHEDENQWTLSIFNKILELLKLINDEKYYVMVDNYKTLYLNEIGFSNILSILNKYNYGLSDIKPNDKQIINSELTSYKLNNVLVTKKLLELRDTKVLKNDNRLNNYIEIMCKNVYL